VSFTYESQHTIGFTVISAYVNTESLFVQTACIYVDTTPASFDTPGVKTPSTGTEKITKGTAKESSKDSGMYDSLQLIRAADITQGFLYESQVCH